MSVILPPEPPAFVETDVASRLDAIVDRATTAASSLPRPRPGSRRRDRARDGGRGSPPRRGARRARDGGDRLRRLRGQGHQELRRHGVPLRPPTRQAHGRRHRGGPRARALVRRGADRRGARPVADHEPYLDRALQGDRRGEDAQRRGLPTVGARGPLRRARDRHRPYRRRGGRAAAGRAPGRARRHARRLAVPVPSRRRRLHLDHGGPEGRPRDQRGGQALHRRGARERARLRPSQRRRRDGGDGRPDLQDLRRVRDLPRRADARGRRRGPRRPRRRARAHGRPPALGCRGRRARRRRVRGGRQDAHRGARAELPGARRAGRHPARRRTPRSCSRRCRRISRRSRAIRSCARS